MSWLPTEANGSTPFERVFALRPNLFEAWAEFASLFWERRLVDPVLLELCRLRIAQLNGAAWNQSTRMEEARAAGLDEQKIAALADWPRSPLFSPLECACLGFAEQFVLDPNGINDADAAPVTAALGDAGTVAFVEALAVFDGFSRFSRLLGIAPAEDA